MSQRRSESTFGVEVELRKNQSFKVLQQGNHSPKGFLRCVKVMQSRSSDNRPCSSPVSNIGGAHEGLRPANRICTLLLHGVLFCSLCAASSF